MAIVVVDVTMWQVQVVKTCTMAARAELCSVSGGAAGRLAAGLPGGHRPRRARAAVGGALQAPPLQRRRGSAQEGRAAAHHCGCSGATAGATQAQLFLAQAASGLCLPR